MTESDGALMPLDQPTQSEGRPGEGADASRRTHLANERTYLAWWRSGLAAIALAVAIGAVLPQLTADGRDLGLVGVGVGFGILGVLAVIYGGIRERNVARAIAHGGYAPFPRHAVALLTLAAAALGLGAVVLVIIGA